MAHPDMTVKLMPTYQINGWVKKDRFIGLLVHSFLVHGIETSYNNHSNIRQLHNDVPRFVVLQLVFQNVHTIILRL